VHAGLHWYPGLGSQTPVRLRNAGRSLKSIGSWLPGASDILRDLRCYSRSLLNRSTVRGRSPIPIFLALACWNHCDEPCDDEPRRPCSIPRATHSKLGMRWRPITQESVRDGVGIWIDSRLISCQSLLSPIVPSVFVAAYRGSEDCGALAVYKGFGSSADGVPWILGVIRPKQAIAPKND
jgi:hypothetical protein